jgi:NAD(P)H-nitrite reductase large subunit
VNTSTKEKVADLVATFKSTGRIVIVGASLAGLRAAEALRKEGFTGQLTIIGDEAEEPYDRPPLSKQVLIGAIAAEMQRDHGVDLRTGIGVKSLEGDAKAMCGVPDSPTTPWWSVTWC